MNPTTIIRRRGHGALDRRLAAGESIDGDGRLAHRARTLASPDSRRSLARSLRTIVGSAERRPAPTSRAPIARRQVVEAAEEVRRLATRLESSDPVDPRGVAKARLLVIDGSGPLYNRRAMQGLGPAARAARLALSA